MARYAGGHLALMVTNGKGERMPDPGRLRAELERLGLSPYEAKAYMSLLQGGELNAIQVSEMSGVPKTRVYDVLMTLQRKGFLHQHPGKVTKYAPVDVRFALAGHISNLRAEAQREIGEKVATVSALTPMLEEFVKDTRTDIPAEYVWFVKDPYQVSVAVSRSMLSAKKQIVTLEKAPYAPQQEDQRNALVAKSKAGVDVRSIYKFDRDSIPPDAIGFIGRLRDAGGHVRFLDSVPCKIAVCDSKEVWLALEDPLSLRKDFVALIIQHPSAAESLVRLFELLWEKSMKYSTVEDELKSWSR